MAFRIVGFVQVYNEIRKGNLERFVHHILPYIDELVVYDDGSTDGSYEYVKQYTPHVIRGYKNDFQNELDHKQKLLDLALTLEPDFILWLDADEVLAKNTNIQELCQDMINSGHDCMGMKEINLWRSKCYARVDSLYNEGWFVRLWKVTPGIRFNIENGLHKQQYPITLTNPIFTIKTAVIHYGFSNDLNLSFKFFSYRKEGQSDYWLYRILLEKNTDGITLLNKDTQIDLRLEQVPSTLIPDELIVNEEPPDVRSFEDAFRAISVYRDLVLKPNITFVCLIHKSTKWLKFFYNSFLKYTDLRNNEFFFIANDANEYVLEYLRNHRLPHYEFHNTDEQRAEWYINNVYRAYNYASTVAKGDYLVFLNSDMAFSPGWFENLFVKLTDNNCVCSRLVESGKFRSGLYGIEKNFGTDTHNYQEEVFVEYAQNIAVNEVHDGGLYMPLLIRKSDFDKVGKYPEGNILPSSDIYNPEYAKVGEFCISGDVTLMKKLRKIGIRHQTAFNSIVYHFQQGETDDPSITIEKNLSHSNVMIICNDYITGRNSERVLWNHLIDLYPNCYGVDRDIIGKADHFEEAASQYILNSYKNTGIVLQNCSFMGNINTAATKILYLQDNLRKMNYNDALLNQQNTNLKNSHYVVSNSVSCAGSYPEYDCHIIPIGVDSDIFKPLDKEEMRRKHNFNHEKIGIFVGEFTAVKGWNRIRTIIEHRNDIYWILVSKNPNDAYSRENAMTYNTISHELLVELINCADFFILGSPVETLCLSAIEACLCDVPVIMNNTGIFYEFSTHDKMLVGEIGDKIEEAIDRLHNTYKPRETIIKNKLTYLEVMKKWKKFFESVQLNLDSQLIKDQVLLYK